MKARRVLGAATAALLTGTMLGAAPTAVAGDNDRSDWTGTRALRFEEDAAEGVQLVTSLNRWALVAREVSQPVDAPEVWRLRERARDGQWGRPLNLPSEVNTFRFATNRNGWTIGAYVADGKLWGVLHTPAGRTASTKELGPEVAGAMPYVITTDRRNGDGLIVYGGKHYRHAPATGGQDNYMPPRWQTAEDPDPDHGTAETVHYAFTWDLNLLAFWQPRNTENLMVSKRAATPTGPVWTAPRNLGSGEFFQAYQQAAAGDRLITTNAADGVTLWDYQTTTQDPATFDFTNRRSLSGPTAGNGSVSAIYALVDRLGTLTVGWREPRVDQGGLVLWQDDRPQGTYLERPTFIGGTRDGYFHVVVSPRGNISVVVQPNARRWAPFKVKHLAAAKTSWTRWLSLDTPAHPFINQRTAVGMPQWNGDLSIATNDARGTYALSFDAPRPVTKMTRPLRTVQYDRDYRVAWNTTWAYAADWQVRARVDKGRTYGPWRNVAVPEGQRFKEVTRPFGETRCYQARAVLKDALDKTPWSKQRCVTVRR